MGRQQRCRRRRLHGGKWKPGSEISFKRFDGWKSGTAPAFEKVIVKQIASAGTRRALLEKGDADLSFNLPPKDFSELVAAGKLKVIGTPVDAELLYMDMNATVAPFDNPLVRKAVAYAIPYSDILGSALFNRGIGMSGGPTRSPPPPGRSPLPTRPISKRPRPCSPRRAFPMASRQRFPMT